MQTSIEIGQRYGKLTIVDWYRDRNKSGRSQIFAVCACDCGGSHTLKYQSLKYDCGNSCPSCRQSPRLTNNRCKTIKTYYKSIVYNSKRRGRTVDVSIDDIENLLEKQNYKCALSGIDISISDGTASLDRINNEQSYTLDNIQWVHKHINYMKGDLPLDIFLDLCKTVTENKNI